MRPAFVCPLVFLVATALAWPESQPGHPSGADLEGEVTGIFKRSRPSGALIGEILVRGSTSTTGSTSLTVNEDTRIWRWEDGQKVPTDLDAVEEGVRILAWFANSRALLTYPLRATAREIGILPPASSERPPPPSPSPAEEQPVRIGGNVLAARLLERVDPEYPILAKESRVQGVVLLQVVVDKEGYVEEVIVIRGHPLLTPAAAEAVRQWRYRPVTLSGRPVKVIATVTVNFALP